MDSYALTAAQQKEVDAINDYWKKVDAAIAEMRATAETRRVDESFRLAEAKAEDEAAAAEAEAEAAADPAAAVAAEEEADVSPETIVAHAALTVCNECGGCNDADDGRDGPLRGIDHY